MSSSNEYLLSRRFIPSSYESGVQVGSLMRFSLLEVGPGTCARVCPERADSRRDVENWRVRREEAARPRFFTVLRWGGWGCVVEMGTPWRGGLILASLPQLLVPAAVTG